MQNASVHGKLLLVAFIWGIGWVAGRVVAQEIPPFTAGWIRYILAVACFLAFLKFTNQWKLPSKEQWYSLAQIGFLSTFVYQAFFMYGMKYTAAGDASLMITFNPLFTAILAIPFLGEKFDRRLALGIFLAFSGVAVLGWYSPNVNIPNNERLLGDALIGLAALSWASATILMKKVMTGENALSPLHLTVWASTVGLLIQTPAALVEIAYVGFEMNASTKAWLWILFLAIGSTVLSYVWFADGIKIIGAARASFYVYLVPIFGIFGGYLLLNEKLGLSLAVSFLLIAGGVYLAQSKQSSTPDA
ncbi:MAG: DMT family transporter [Euryarchaeota archaeon]